MQNKQPDQGQFSCRKLELNDYYKGFLTCLSYLTKTPEMTFQRFQEICENYSGTVFVIEDLEKKLIVSSISLVIDQNIFDTKLYLENVVTIPEYRGKGLMKQLMEKVIEEAKFYKNTHECNQGENCQIELYCKEETKQIYQKFGFKEIGTIYSEYL